MTVTLYVTNVLGKLVIPSFQLAYRNKLNCIMKSHLSEIAPQPQPKLRPKEGKIIYGTHVCSSSYD